MSSPVTWYRITNLVIALGFAVGKYTQGTLGEKVNVVDFAGGISTGAVLYVIGWWEDSPRLRWYFKTDWRGQLQAVTNLRTSGVPRIKSFMKSLTPRDLFCALLIVFQFVLVSISVGLHFYDYQGKSPFLKILLSCFFTEFFPTLWLVVKRYPPTRIERVYFGISAAVLLYFGLFLVMKPPAGYHMLLICSVAFFMFVLACSLVANAAAKGILVPTEHND